ncbi:MAG: glycosyltransferase [Kiritimatiellae bacterium]|nr:glycosyltransferase [Kiritimatiellia bacterium]
MNILFVCTSNPLETDNGSVQRTNVLWCALRKIGTVYTVVLRREGDAEITDEENRIRTAFVYRNGIVGKIQSLLWTHFHKPTVWAFTSPFLRRNPWRNVKFDWAVCRYIEPMAASRAWKIAPVAVDIDDWTPQTHATVYNPKCAWWRRRAAQWAVDRWCEYFVRKCTAAWLPNPGHLPMVERLGVKATLLPNLAMPPRAGYSRHGRQRPMLLTVGLMSHLPNHEGVAWFLDNFWPALHKRFPQLEYAIAGKDMPQKLQERCNATPGVKYMGFVEDIDALYEEAIAVAAPILSGSGTCIKVIEAALHGRFTFATPFAARGIAQDDMERLGIVPIDTLAGRLEDMMAGKDIERMQESIAAAAEVYNSRTAFEQRVHDVLRTAAS